MNYNNFSIYYFKIAGAVPIATINLQKGKVRPGQTIPDSWHHQMIFGVGPGRFGTPRIYLTNPLESVDEESLRDQLCSPSELLIRRNDVLQRWKVPNEEGSHISPVSDLQNLCDQPDERWDHYNVLGQVVNIIREEQFQKRSLQQNQQQQHPNSGSGNQSNMQYKQHIKIPADYKVRCNSYLNPGY